MHYITTFMGTCNVMTPVTTMQFFIKVMSSLRAMKPHLNGHMIYRIIHNLLQDPQIYTDYDGGLH